jgi:hypothetical protein
MDPSRGRGSSLVQVVMDGILMTSLANELSDTGKLLDSGKIC